LVETLLSTSSEDGIPEILAEQRLGHQVPAMRGLYAHASQRMRDELTAALQARWEESLRERATIDPHSPILLLDNLLALYRGRRPGRESAAGASEGDPRRLQTSGRAQGEGADYTARRGVSQRRDADPLPTLRSGRW